MMFKSLFGLFLLAMSAQTDVFKKEMSGLETSVDALVTATGAQVLQRSRAAYIEGYGIIIGLELAFEPPQGIFSTPKAPAEVRKLVAQRRKEIQEKLTAFVKQRVGTTDSIGPTDILAVVIRVLNANPADVPNLPVQILISAKKESPQQVTFSEF